MKSNQNLIFYLDDEVELCELFEDYFKSESVEVKTFSDPFDAIEESLRKPPLIWFLDYRLPKISGDEVAWKIQPHIPKYLITGELSPKVSYSFQGIFHKPYNSEEISEVIKRHLDL